VKEDTTAAAPLVTHKMLAGGLNCQFRMLGKHQAYTVACIRVDFVARQEGCLGQTLTLKPHKQSLGTSSGTALCHWTT